MARNPASKPQPQVILAERKADLAGARLKADNATLVIEATKDGKLRIACKSWPETLVVLAHQDVLLRNVAGQINLFKVGKR